ncbi:MAG: Fic family protein [Opitutales bacterium]|nr:Fic family protein [Opitutales bacterium]MCH8540878.1 Fic family protein [Opitutales bacterium]
MPDWDEDSPKLRGNLVKVLRGIRDAAQQRQPLTLDPIRGWHRGTMKGLDVPHKKFVGYFRGEAGLKGIEVAIGKHSGTPSGQVAAELSDFTDRLGRALSSLDAAITSGADLIADQLEAVLQVCAWAHSEWVRIHPLVNGNGRTARLLANAIALRYGLPPFVRLRPRPNYGYSEAADASMRGDYRPLAQAFHHMLKAVLSEP